MRRMIRVLILAILLALGVIVATGPVRADQNVVAVSLLPGWRTEHGTQIAALRFTLAPDWKTYWRSPGDAGIPPLFNWSGSQNLQAVSLHWPRPHVFLVNGMQSIGYKKELVLPVELTPIDPAKPILLRAMIDLGVCRDICVPASVSLFAELDGKGGPDPLIRAALDDRPETGTEAGLSGIDCAVEPIEDGLRITATLALPSVGGAETVVFEPRAGAVWVSESQVSRAGNILTATADLVPDAGEPLVLNRGNVTVTVLGRDRAVEITGCPAP